ncbi:MAG: lipocalin family protein [Bacteroidia bacterium]
MKQIISFILVAFALTLMFSSCAEAIVKLSKSLDGTWNATSIKVSGEEKIPNEVYAYSYTFTDNGEGMGDVAISISVTADQTVIQRGEYLVDSKENGDKLIFITGNDSTPLDMELDGNTLTLMYQSNNEITVIVTEKE